MAIFEQGDIIRVNFDPTVDHEPQKSHPALVLSASDFNIRSSMTIVAPITSVYNGYPMHVPLSESDDVAGCVCVEALRALDLNARSCELVGSASEDTFNEVLNRVGAIFGI